MDTVTLPQTGGCLCGACRFELRASPLLAYAGHCHACQSRSGSAFTLTLVAYTADVTLSGATDTRRVTNPSGREIDQTICAVCRSPLVSTAPAAADFISLRAGALDDAGWVLPIAQTCTESAIPWAIIPGVRQVAWADFDYAEFGRQWLETAPAFAAAAPR